VHYACKQERTEQQQKQQKEQQKNTKRGRTHPRELCINDAVAERALPDQATVGMSCTIKRSESLLQAQHLQLHIRAGLAHVLRVLSLLA